MPPTRVLRPADERDRPAVVNVVRDAFADGGRDGQEEINIVERTWSLRAAIDPLELVAVEGSLVVGYVLGARGDLGGREVVGLAPLAVTPPYQGQGVGSALMTELVRRADQDGWPVIVLLGNPSYYRRFAFEPSGPLGIECPSVGLGNPHFLVRRLRNYDSSCRGDFAYRWEGP